MPAPSNDSYGEFTTPTEVRLIRVLPGPIERVWAFLTDPQKRARWLGGGSIEQKRGGKIEFLMHHAKIAPNEVPPEKYKHVHDTGVRFDGTVLRCEPPHLLVHTFGSPNSEVTFELKPQGNQVLLVLTHRTQGDEIPDLTNYSAGWHAHLALLVATLEGKALPPFWSEHARLHVHYQRVHAALPR